MGLQEMLAKKSAGQTTAQPGGQGTPRPGGGRLAAINEKIRNAKITHSKNDIPLGEGWFLIKDAKCSKAERSEHVFTNFNVVCIKAIKDGANNIPGVQGYAGPVVGDEYVAGVYQKGDYQIDNDLKILKSALGWTNEDLQNRVRGSEDDVARLREILGSFFGMEQDMETPINTPYLFSNFLVVRMHCQRDIYDVKVTVDNKKIVVKDDDGNPVKKERNNVYWDGKVDLEDVIKEVPEDVILRAFGSQEAIEKAIEIEKELSAF